MDNNIKTTTRPVQFFGIEFSECDIDLLTKILMENNQGTKKTWGNVTPGKRTEGEENALNPAEKNAENKDSDNVSSTQMDPDDEKKEE